MDDKLNELEQMIIKWLNENKNEISDTSIMSEKVLLLHARTETKKNYNIIKTLLEYYHSKNKADKERFLLDYYNTCHMNIQNIFSDIADDLKEILPDEYRHIQMLYPIGHPLMNKDYIQFKNDFSDIQTRIFMDSNTTNQLGNDIKLNYLYKFISKNDRKKEEYAYLTSLDNSARKVKNNEDDNINDESQKAFNDLYKLLHIVNKTITPKTYPKLYDLFLEMRKTNQFDDLASKISLVSTKNIISTVSGLKMSLSDFYVISNIDTSSSGDPNMQNYYNPIFMWLFYNLQDESEIVKYETNLLERSLKINSNLKPQEFMEHLLTLYLRQCINNKSIMKTAVFRWIYHDICTIKTILPREGNKSVKNISIDDFSNCKYLSSNPACSKKKTF